MLILMKEDKTIPSLVISGLSSWLHFVKDLSFGFTSFVKKYIN
jgi:hypothetical protein